MEEQVQLYDDHGDPAGVMPRSRMRADNLLHGATAVVVRDPMGRVYVHRRTDTKDVYPGRWDFAAGGVLCAGEEPDDAAVRELAEELGISGVELEPWGRERYDDDHTSYWGFRYLAEWDGPVTWQPEEVAGGDWMPLERLAALLDDPAWPVMPDTAALWGPWVRERAADRVEPQQGWDSHTAIVEGRWVDRVPRRPEVAPRLLAETRLMPRLAPMLGLEVPVPVVLEEEPLRVRHLLVRGEPCDPERLTADDGRAMARFLRTLHATPETTYADTGVPDARTGWRGLLEMLEALHQRVIPLLPADRRADGRSLLEQAAVPTTPVLVHGDLGPTHLLVREGRVTGVIDWSDAVVGDPSLDLAWTLHGTPAVFADALAEEYGVTPELAERGLMWHRLGPWWEALAGVDELGQEFVDSGLAGILDRLGDARSHGGVW